MSVLPSSSKPVSRGFTLIELLVVVAIIAVLAAILFPVFAQAKVAGRTTSTISSLRQIGLGATYYLNDYDGTVVMTQQVQNDTDHVWARTLRPYLASRQVYFDPSRKQPDDAAERLEIARDFAYPWYNVTTFAINDEGYTGYRKSVGGTCTGRSADDGYVYVGRMLAAMDEPERRVAFVPNQWHSSDLGWHLVKSAEASRPRMGTVYTWLSSSNQVWDLRNVYSGGQIPTVRADGSAGKLKPADFLNRKTTPTMAGFCAWMEAGGKRTWGAFWNMN